MTPSVLVVDDSISVRVNLQHALTIAGFNASACESLALARKALQNTTFDLLLLDVLLPDGNGFDLVQEVRGKSSRSDTAVILLSGEAAVSHRIRGLHAGADDYIGKPYSTSFVIARARHVLEAYSKDVRRIAATGEREKRILLVDDSMTFLNAFADSLRADGHDVVLAKSGTEALSYLSAQAADAVVLDVFMPGMTGLEVNRRIKSMSAHADTRVMLLTGRDDSMAKASGISAGVDDFVVKSADIGVMKARLLDMLRRPAGGGNSRSRLSATPAVGVPTVRKSDSIRPSSAPPPRSETEGIKMPESYRVNDTGTRTSPLFERLLSVCGLPGVVGRGSMKRALDRAGADVVALTPEGLQKALDEIRTTLSVFLPAADVAQHMEAIAALARKR